MKTVHLRFLALGLLVALGACRGSAPEKITPLAADSAWDASEVEAGLLSRSCPDGAAEGYEMSVLLGVEPVSLGARDEVAAALTGVDYVGGWALSAELASFGGLSDLRVQPDGNLLAVSDAGAFVAIGFDQQALAPTGTATLSYLTDEDGDILGGKTRADAEGLELLGGLALVSFERDHRVVAYGRGLCGSQARGVEIARFGSSPATLGSSIRGNAGAEALALKGDTLMLGLETVIDGLGPIAVIDRSGQPQFTARPWLEGAGMPLVSMAWAGDTLYSLHRAWNPITGNSIRIVRTGPEGEALTVATLSRPLNVDNFEGIAAEPLPDGRTRLYLISDDNFSNDQRTLLFIFETQN